MKMKAFSLLFALILAFSLPTAVFAASPYNYIFESGADSAETFGGATSTDNPVAPNPAAANIRRNKDAAYFPPSYGVFSGDIPTDPTSLYHDNSAPYSGYTGDTGTGGYSTSDYGGSVSPTTGTDYGGLLPSTSISTSTADIVNTQPSYYDDGSLGTLSIPAIDLNVKVYEGETLDSMKKGVGHFEYTSVWDGTVGFAGHNRGASAYFSGVKKLNIGDTLTYSTKYGTRTYEIYYKEKISDTDYSNLGWSAENTAVLITCVENVPDMRWCIMAREK
jgi:sortase A